MGVFVCMVPVQTFAMTNQSFTSEQIGVVVFYLLSTFATRVLVSGLVIPRVWVVRQSLLLVSFSPFCLSVLLVGLFLAEGERVCVLCARVSVGVGVFGGGGGGLLGTEVGNASVVTLGCSFRRNLGPLPFFPRTPVYVWSSVPRTDSFVARFIPRDGSVSTHARIHTPFISPPHPTIILLYIIFTESKKRKRNNGAMKGEISLSSQSLVMGTKTQTHSQTHSPPNTRSR